MAAFDDVDLRIVGELRRAEVERGGALGEGGEHIQFGDGGSDALQLRDERRELVEQLFVEEFFACQCAVIGGECFVLEGFQFRCDVALGVLQRLAAAVVVRHVDGLGRAHFDVEAVHTVVFHFQCSDASAGAFTHFQFEEEIAAVGLDAS